MTFSVVGFFVGAICAIILFVVATALIAFEHSTLVFGLLALGLWAFLTFNWPARGGGTVVR